MILKSELIAKNKTAAVGAVWRYRCGIINWRRNTQNRHRNKGTGKLSIY